MATSNINHKYIVIGDKSKMIRAEEVMERIKKMELQYVANKDENLTYDIQNKVKMTDWSNIAETNQFYKAKADEDLLVEDDLWYRSMLQNMEENRCVSTKIAERTRYEKIKRFILKIMRVGLRWQEEFNTSVLHFAQASVNKINLLASKNHQLSQQNDILKKRIEKIGSQLDLMDRKMANNEKWLSEVSKTVKNNEDWLKGVSEIVKNNEDWLKGVSEIVKNNEDWLKAESVKVDNNENMYDKLRKELFFEIEKNSRDKSGSKECLIKKSTNIKKEKYRKIKINLGCGPLDMDGYINIDMRDLPNVDIVTDVLNLPFKEYEIDEIYTSHLIEHFTTMQMEKEILPYWYKLLKEGGKLVAILPNIGFMAKTYAEGKIPFDQLAELISGGQEYEGNYHLAVYDKDKMVNVLKKVGFREINVVEESRKNGLCWEMEIHAIK